MIGLCRGLAYQAFSELYGKREARYYMTNCVTYKTFGMTPRDVCTDHPANIRYYQLLDACKLRMRPEPEWLEIPEFLRKQQ